MDVSYVNVLSILYILSFIYFSIHLFIQQITLQRQKDIGFQMSIQTIWRVKHNVASLLNEINKHFFEYTIIGMNRLNRAKIVQFKSTLFE